MIDSASSVQHCSVKRLIVLITPFKNLDKETRNEGGEATNSWS